MSSWCNKLSKAVYNLVRSFCKMYVLKKNSNAHCHVQVHIQSCNIERLHDCDFSNWKPLQKMTSHSCELLLRVVAVLAFSTSLTWTKKWRKMTGTCSNIKSLLQSAGFVFFFLLFPSSLLYTSFVIGIGKIQVHIGMTHILFKRAFGILYMLFAFYFVITALLNLPLHDFM